MKLIIGLGNPGKKYEHTWHNLGFLAVENFRQLSDLPKFKKSAKFQAEVSNGDFNGEKIILARPQTFMNNSGQSVVALTHYYKLQPKDIIVIHDDLDLPLERIRLGWNSSAGGHNGIKSIIELLGTQAFFRIKLGIATELLKKIAPADYVLTSWNKDEKTLVERQIKNAAEATRNILESGLEKSMAKWN
jgi:PTH1 family peptidyl-tRNA hydrolase